MKKLTTLFTTLILMVVSVSSQTIYPKKLVIGQDTIVAISQKQIRDCNLLFVDRDRNIEIKDSLLLEITSRDTLNSLMKKSDQLKSYEILWLQELNGSFNQMNESLKIQLAAEKKKVWIQKSYKYIGFTSAIVLGILYIAK